MNHGTLTHVFFIKKVFYTLDQRSIQGKHVDKVYFTFRIGGIIFRGITGRGRLSPFTLFSKPVFVDQNFSVLEFEKCRYFLYCNW